MSDWPKSKPSTKCQRANAEATQRERDRKTQMAEALWRGRNHLDTDEPR